MPSPSPTSTFEEPGHVPEVGPGVNSAQTITVASYNMRKAIGTDRRRRPERALQEADKRMGGRGSAVPHELIDEHGLYKPVPFRVRHRRTLENLPGGRHAE